MDFDVIIIGGGAAGTKLALELGKKKLNVACIEKNEFIGGARIFEGCLSQKFLLQGAINYFNISSVAPEYGIKVADQRINFDVLKSRKDKLLYDLSQNLLYKLKLYNIKVIKGSVNQIKSQEVNYLDENNNNQKLTAEKIVLATGTQVDRNFNKERLNFSPTEMKNIPREMAIIGAGYIGIENAVLWKMLGSNVKVFEKYDEILKDFDLDLASGLRDCLNNKGINFDLDKEVKSFNTTDLYIRVNNEDEDFDQVLICYGRKPNSHWLKDFIQMDDKGFVIVNEEFETNLPGVFAIGDLIGAPFFANKAFFEAYKLALIFTKSPDIGKLKANLLVHSLNSLPEIAYVGAKEKDLKAQNIEYDLTTVELASIERARIEKTKEGWMKIMFDKKSRKVLGAKTLGNNTINLITTFVKFLEDEVTIDDFKNYFFSHPSLEEIWQEFS